MTGLCDARVSPVVVERAERFERGFGAFGFALPRCRDQCGNRDGHVLRPEDARGYCGGIGNRMRERGHERILKRSV